MRFERKISFLATIVFVLLLFTANAYANTVTASSEGDGTISPEGSNPETWTFTITPDPLYQVADVVVDPKPNKPGTSVLADCVFDENNPSNMACIYTFPESERENDHSIVASFALAPVPVASFEVDPNYPPSGTSEPDVTVQFNDTSLNNPTSWLWDFGDTTTNTAQNPNHTFTTDGTFTVTLSVFNAIGQEVSSYSMDYTVNPILSDVPVILEGNPERFTSAQTAYQSIPLYGGDTMKVKAGDQGIFDLDFNRDVVVKLLGGYDDNFAEVVGFTVVDNKVTISSGEVTVSNVIIRSL